MTSGCGDTLSLVDLQTAKKHQIFEAEVITGKQGGIAGGADIETATNPVTLQVQKTLPAILRDTGFEPASFDFTTGGTLGVNDRDKVVYDPVSKTWYSWGGSLPHVIAAGTNPVGDVNWTPQTDPNLRTDLASTIDGKGDELVAVKQHLTGTVSRTQDGKNADWISVKDFGAVGDGVVDDTVAFQTALSASLQIFIPSGVYKITGALTPPAYVNIKGAGKYCTKLRLDSNDVDLLTLQWYSSLSDIALESTVTSGEKGLVRLQSTTFSEVPPSTITAGGLSYVNRLYNVELRGGQNYNIIGVNIGYTEWRNTDSLLAKGAVGAIMQGGATYNVNGTTLFMSGVNRMTACLGGGALALNNMFACRIFGIFEGNNGPAITLGGTATSMHIDGYFENNYTNGGGSSRGVVEFQTGLTYDCRVDGYFDTLNADYAVKIADYVTGNQNTVCFMSASQHKANPYVSGFYNNSSSVWSADLGLEYYKALNLGPSRQSGKMSFNQNLSVSPYSVIPNPKFNRVTSGAFDNWTFPAGQVSIQPFGFAGSTNFAQMGAYPSAYLQSSSSFHNRMEVNSGNYTLIIVARGGSLIDITNGSGSNVTQLLMAGTGVPSSIPIPKFTFGSEWTMYEVDLSKLFAGDFPLKSAITSLMVKVFATSGTQISYIGMHNNSAGSFIPADL